MSWVVLKITIGFNSTFRSVCNYRFVNNHQYNHQRQEVCKMAIVGNRRGWIAVACLNVTWMLWTGTIKGLGLMIPSLMEQFTAQTWLIGWMIAIVIAVINISGNLSSVKISSSFLFGNHSSSFLLSFSFITHSYWYYYLK